MKADIGQLKLSNLLLAGAAVQILIGVWLLSKVGWRPDLYAEICQGICHHQKESSPVYILTFPFFSIIAAAYFEYRKNKRSENQEFDFRFFVVIFYAVVTVAAIVRFRLVLWSGII